ncbi:hypothetical protein ABZ832_28500 [Streptantibioticus parmotrematis]|uniref:hypothetical protein n=1 Tax=Streptantibioticus parmotrematis TaxID=2873249 RepID=UPI0033EE7089
MTYPPTTGEAVPDTTTLEALRRVVAAQIGPREPGVIYETSVSAYEVLAVVRDPQRARELLGRRCAQWAAIVRDIFRPDAEPFAIGTVWTTSDRLIRSADVAHRAARR